MSHHNLGRIIINLITLTSLLLLLSIRSVASAEAKQRHAIVFGSAVRDTELLNNDAMYREVLLREYAMITPEYGFKFGHLRDDLHGYRWEEVDRFVAFAKTHQLKVHGHTLVWHGSTAHWVYKLESSDMASVLEDHIKTTVKHFGADVPLWDVVNEAMAKDGYLRPATKDIKDLSGSVWRSVGDDYIGKSFHWAKQAADEIGIHPELIYNDYSIETINPKSNGLYQLLLALKKNGVPIDGVGFQFHIDMADITDVEAFANKIKANFARFADAGFAIHITELDVAGCYSEADFAKQASIYKAIALVCHNQPSCKSITTWGFTDRYTWLHEPKWGGRRAAEQKPLLFDELFQPKLAYFSFHSVFQE